MYHLSDQQQVSNLSHVGLHSSEMTFQKVQQTQSFNAFKNVIKERALDESLSH